jgi:hypothetical protein
MKRLLLEIDCDDDVLTDDTKRLRLAAVFAQLRQSIISAEPTVIIMERDGLCGSMAIEAVRKCRSR